MRGDIALFLGLVGVVGGAIVVAVILLVDGGGGGSPCDEPLAPLGGGEADVSQAGFDKEDEGLTRVIQAAEVGNLPAVEANFFGEVHNFTHNVDPSIREEDPELATELCESVIRLEEELALDQRTSVIVEEATRVRELLRDGAELLGFQRPGG